MYRQQKNAKRRIKRKDKKQAVPTNKKPQKKLFCGFCLLRSIIDLFFFGSVPVVVDLLYVVVLLEVFDEKSHLFEVIFVVEGYVV